MLQSRLLMNLRGIGISFIPRYFFQINLDKIFNDILKYNIKDLEEIQTRVKYYNQINEFFTPTAKEKIGKFPFKSTSYAFDAYENTSFLNKIKIRINFAYLFSLKIKSNKILIF